MSVLTTHLGLGSIRSRSSRRETVSSSNLNSTHTSENQSQMHQLVKCTL